MTTTHLIPSAQDAFGQRVARRLAAGTADLPYDVSERLRAARMQAVAQRKKEALGLRRAPAVAATGGGSATLNFGDEGLTFWSRIASVLPLLALVAGLVAIHTVENEQRAREVAEVDAALLTDDLPPAAYADPGFVEFLKSSGQ
ncbi:MULTISPECIES: DUF3619 family protein [Ramlibacter]|uniref:DUF3619 family protein n=1 Tax=Ramlibacter aquaticus TaxID=2780094 RepID=A0ABR9SCT1_9BURK|nr:MULTISPECIES: DUF3619 family protein [Ramlibacter]MBE7940163.1 DUF3619 family protein [Ramlibacter aquaticus]